MYIYMQVYIYVCVYIKGKKFKIKTLKTSLIISTIINKIFETNYVK